MRWFAIMPSLLSLVPLCTCVSVTAAVVCADNGIALRDRGARGTSCQSRRHCDWCCCKCHCDWHCVCMQISVLNSEKEVLEESAATANAKVQETREAMAAQAKQLGQLQYLPPRLQDMQVQV